MPLRLGHAVMLVMAVGAVSPALGQFKDESKYGDLRNYCPLAAQILSKGREGSNYDWTLALVRQCDATGPEALAVVWRRTVDSSDLDALYWSSRFLQDQRLVNAVASVLADRNRSPLDRLNALRAVAAFIIPRHSSNRWALFPTHRLDSVN